MDWPFANIDTRILFWLPAFELLLFILKFLLRLANPLLLLLLLSSLSCPWHVLCRTEWMRSA